MTKAFVLLICILSLNAYARGGGANSTESKGFYWVPVTPDLIQFSAFSISNLETKIEGQNIKVEYDLPLELTGVLNRIEFSGARPQSGEMILTSNQGTMTCPDSSKIRNCKVAYKNLSFDASARDQILSAIAKTPAELAQRNSVAQMFEYGQNPQCEPNKAFRMFGIGISDGGEPHGFLSVAE